MCKAPILPDWLCKSESHDNSLKSPSKLAFLNKTISHLGNVFSQELLNTSSSNKTGFLQHIDPRCKLIVVLSFMLLINFSHSYITYFIVFIVSLLYSSLSKICISSMLKRVWFVIPLFILICSFPGFTNMFVSGHSIIILISPNDNRSWLQNGLYITDNGFYSVSKLVIRSGLAISLAYLLLATTKWNDLTISLVKFRFPKVVVEILDMAYRYIFMIAKIGLQISQARYLRSVGHLPIKENRRFIAHSLAILFIKTAFIANEVQSAMKLRGYKYPVTLRELKINLADYIFIANNFIIIALTLFLAR